MKRIFGKIAVLAVVVAPVLAWAGLDAPHDQTYGNATFACDNCHALAVTSAGGKKDYSQGCVACHNKPGRLYPWSAGDQAVPGQVGNQHSWTGFADSPAHGAMNPGALTFSQKLVDGKLQCAVCHDPHRGGQDFAPSSQKVSMAVKGWSAPTAGSGANMWIETVPTTPKAFRVKFTANATGGIIVSHDYGLSQPTWFNYVGGAWQPGVDDGPGRPVTANTLVTLDDPATQVKFTALAPAGTSWDFTVAYPFLRATAVGDQLCFQCHAERVMGSARVRGDDPYVKPNGTRMFSHPVGEGLGSNGKKYDQPYVLDATGVSSQMPGDGFAHNDLVLQGNAVMCTTCHGTHSADSNSLTP